jgi:molybdate transport system substrate-binding protein
MRVVARTVVMMAVLISLAGMAAAAEIRVLSVGAVQQALRNLTAEFEQETGHKIVLSIDSPVATMQKIKAGEPHDAVIVSEPAMDQLDQDGIVNPESRVPLASTGLGVAVREGTALPNLSTPESFKQALLGAKSIVYGDPALPNQSGEKAEKILRQAGIFDALKPKLKIVPGQATSQEMVAKGDADIGLYNVSEIPEGKGLKLAGPVPAPLQIATMYEAAVMSEGSVPEAARAFILFLSSREARAKWIAAKLEPAAKR